MIVGTVTAAGIPVLPLPVAGQSWSAVIDTGFNGDLELPNSLWPFVNPRFLCHCHSHLAGGQTIQEDIYLVDFPFDGQTILAEASFVQGAEILLGTHLLRNCRLEVNFVARTVLVERVV